MTMAAKPPTTPPTTAPTLTSGELLLELPCGRTQAPLPQAAALDTAVVVYEPGPAAAMRAVIVVAKLPVFSVSSAV